LNEFGRNEIAKLFMEGIWEIYCR